jgi:hypothetical protein
MSKHEKASLSSSEPKICGIVMPISECDGCSEHHWIEVKSIITDAVASAGFEAKLVSFARDVGVIHERIVQNLYENPIVVCDVSGRNPNVMFELGMRLAFDKPAIIIKDDRTSYSFDTSGIEHVEYPRDLRFSKIVEFKERLAAKISATFERSQSDKEYTTFLKRFGKFEVAKIETKEVSRDEFYQRQFDDLKQMIVNLSNKGLSRGKFRGGEVELEAIKRIVGSRDERQLKILERRLQSMAPDELESLRKRIILEWDAIRKELDEYTGSSETFLNLARILDI